MKTKFYSDDFDGHTDGQRILSVVCAYFPDNKRISALASSLLTAGDVIIVNNGGVIELNLDSNKNKVSIINPIRNLGTLASYNLIINNFHDYDYYWLWNQDTEITENALGHFISNARNIFHHDKSVVCVTIYDKKNFVYPLDSKLILTRESTTMICKNRLQKMLPDCFDENLFMDYGDWDFSYRLYKAGGRVYQLDDVRVGHQLGEPEKTIFGTMNRSSSMRLHMQGINTAYLIRKHGVFNFPNALLILRFFFLPFKNLLFKYSIKRSRQFISGVISGIKGELSSTYAASLNRSIK
jgi:GT2 family glycosyltransferase